MSQHTKKLVKKILRMHSSHNCFNNYIGSVIMSLTLHSKLLVEANSVRIEEHNLKAVKAALKVMNKHLSALNKLDTVAMASTLHFPHFRLVGASLRVCETADRHFDDFRALAGECIGPIRSYLRPYQYLQPQIKFILMFK